MGLFVYSALDGEEEEIRLLSLMPGEPGDPITLAISHAPLHQPDEQPDAQPARLPLDEVRKTVPDGWWVGETLDDRYIFECESLEKTSWDHPDPSIPRALYDLSLPKPWLAYETKYEALSYVWGSPENTVEVYVRHSAGSQSDHNNETPMTMHIGRSLASALTHLRYPDRPRRLWVDAVCINQADIEEREKQVKRMDSIYSLAQRVVIWLGPEADDSTHALSTLAYFTAQVEFTKDNFGLASPAAAEPSWCHGDTPLPYDARTGAALEALFCRPWFDRVWVLQEALLANRQALVQCGAASLPWTSLRGAMSILSGKPNLPLGLLDMMDVYSTALETAQQRGLPQLLSLARRQRCTDPRDRVYGLLGLMSPAMAARITPSYTVPAVDVYRDTLLAHLGLFGRLELLRHCGIGSASRGLGPSWVPDWASDNGALFRGYNNTRFRQASGSSAAHARYIAQDVLEVTGLACATVLDASSPVSCDATAEERFRYLRDREPVGLRTSKYVTGCSLFDAFLEVVFAGGIYERHLDEYCSCTLPTLIQLKEEYSAASAGGSLSGTNIRHVLRQFSRSLQLITTKEGFLGLAPQGTQPSELLIIITCILGTGADLQDPDDRICVLLGCDYPMVLRPTATGDFLVVGHCFVHGLMDAEGILGPLPAGWEARISYLDDQVANERVATHFHNKVTDELSAEDPRLPPLEPCWERMQTKRTQDDPPCSVFKWFRNRETGETINSDPRLLPDALKKSGVPLETVRLV